jgi:histone H3/H4
VFSLYDIEQFLRDAGAEKVTEKAAISLERELQDTVTGLISEATFYTNYAGRKRLINQSDLALAHNTASAKRGGIANRNVRHKRPKKDAIRRSSAMREFVDQGIVLRAVRGTSSQTQEQQSLYI